MLDLPLFVDAVVRGYASIVFAKRRVSGWLVLVATLLNPVSGVVALWSAVLATAIALSLGYSRPAIDRGHYGCSAILVGLAAAHGRAFTPGLLLVSTFGAMASVLLCSVLSDLLWRSLGLPVLALPALLVMTAVARWQKLEPLSASTDVPALLVVSHSLGAPLDHLLRACGALVFEPSRATGGLVLLAALSYSRISALLGVLGAACALVVCEALGVSTNSAAGLAASYNGVLTAMGVGGVFLAPGRAALVVGALATTGAAFGSATFGSSESASPLWAWPFVLVTWVALRGLRLRGAVRTPFEAPLADATPEQNRDYCAMLRLRFGPPGRPQLALPFAGTWLVSQGVDGEHTHRGDWAHAFDFEITDNDGFPFRGEGRRLHDYYCYEQPVLAPGSGTVVAVHDGTRDQLPGNQDTLRPWGNAVVVQHGPELFSVLAHLQAGSIAVKPGDYVITGQPLARVGASGRSPRPHLHVQMQRTAELGAPTLAFDFVSYCVDARGVQRFSAFGVPAEGARVLPANVAAGPVRTLGLLPGTELSCRWNAAQPVTLRYELSPLGEHSLLDVRRGDRLYFVPGPVLTTYAGKPGSPLAALYWAMPRLPVPSDQRTWFEERLVAGTSLPLFWAALRFVLALLGLTCELVSRGCVERADQVLVVTTTTQLRLWGHALASWGSQVRLGPQGLESIELSGAPARARTPRNSDPSEDRPTPVIESQQSCT